MTMAKLGSNGPMNVASDSERQLDVLRQIGQCGGVRRVSQANSRYGLHGDPLLLRRGVLGRSPEDLPSGRPQMRDRHLKFHEDRDNLVEPRDRVECGVSDASSRRQSIAYAAKNDSLILAGLRPIPTGMPVGVAGGLRFGRDEDPGRNVSIGCMNRITRLVGLLAARPNRSP